MAAWVLLSGFVAVLFVSCGAKVADTTAATPFPTVTPVVVSAPAPTATVEMDPEGSLRSAIRAHAVDPAGIAMVSKFRSMIGHRMLEGEEWSPKHYFMPLPELADADNLVKVYSPVYGVVIRMFEEGLRPRPTGRDRTQVSSGQQIQIGVGGSESVAIILYNISPIAGIEVGTPVTARQQVGFANTKGNSFDIGIGAYGVREQPLFVSYFEVMPDSLFADYQRRGIGSRDELIITEEYRRAHPLPFNSAEGLEEGWAKLSKQ